MDGSTLATIANYQKKWRINLSMFGAEKIRKTRTTFGALIVTAKNLGIHESSGGNRDLKHTWLSNPNQRRIYEQVGSIVKKLRSWETLGITWKALFDSHSLTTFLFLYECVRNFCQLMDNRLWCHRPHDPNFPCFHTYTPCSSNQKITIVYSQMVF